MLWVVRCVGVCDDLDAGLTGEINGLEDLPGGSEQDKQRDFVPARDSGGLLTPLAAIASRRKDSEKIPITHRRNYVPVVGSSPRRFG